MTARPQNQAPPLLAGTAPGGRATMVSGSVVDVRFPAGSLPDINSALDVLWDGPHRLTREVQTHIDPRTARCVAIQETAGLACGCPVRDTGGPIAVPAGNAVLGRLPSRVGYQPTLSTKIAELEERITSDKGAAVTSIQAVYVPADDFTAPAVAQTFSHLGSSIVLSRDMASEGLYPAVDPLASNSTLLDPSVVGQDHFDTAEQVRQLIETYRELGEIISLLGIEELSAADRAAVGRARRLARFLTQPFGVTAQFTGLEGASVSLQDTLAGCRAILDGEADDGADDGADGWAEDSLYMVGTLDLARGKEQAPEAAAP